MKKLIIVLGICFLLVCIPAMRAFSMDITYPRIFYFYKHHSGRIGWSCFNNYEFGYDIFLSIKNWGSDLQKIKRSRVMRRAILK